MNIASAAREAGRITRTHDCARLMRIYEVQHGVALSDDEQRIWSINFMEGLKGK